MGDGARDLAWCQRHANMAWRPKRKKAPPVICPACHKTCVGVSGLWAHEKVMHGISHAELDIRRKQDEETSYWATHPAEAPKGRTP